MVGGRRGSVEVVLEGADAQVTPAMNYIDY